MKTVWLITKEGKIRATALCRTDEETQRIIQRWQEACPDHYIVSCAGRRIVSESQRAKMGADGPVLDENGMPVWEDDPDALIEEAIERMKEIILLELAAARTHGKVKERVLRKKEQILQRLDELEAIISKIQQGS